MPQNVQPTVEPSACTAVAPGQFLLTDITGNLMLTADSFELANSVIADTNASACLTHRVSPLAFHIDTERLDDLQLALEAKDHSVVRHLAD